MSRVCEREIYDGLRKDKVLGYWYDEKHRTKEKESDRQHRDI